MMRLLNHFRRRLRWKFLAALPAFAAGALVLLWPPASHADDMDAALHMWSEIESIDKAMDGSIEALVAFEAKNPYCKPPDAPNKAEDLDWLASMEAQNDEDFAQLLQYRAQLVKLVSSNQSIANQLFQVTGLDFLEGSTWAAYIRKHNTIKNLVKQKRAEVAAAPEVNCSYTPPPDTDTSVTTGQDPVVDPLAGFDIYSPNYKPVDIPTVPDGPLCSEDEKYDIIQAVGEQRGAAAFNALEAQKVVLSLSYALQGVQDPDQIQALNAALATAKAETAARDEIADQLDVLYAKAKALEVVDCDEDDDKVGYLDYGGDKSFYALLTGGYILEMDIPATGAGTVILGSGLETYAFEVAVEDGFYIGAKFGEGPEGPGDWGWEGAFKYGEGEAWGGASVPSGSDSVAITYHDFAPSGSTGVGLGATGLDVMMDAKFSYYDVKMSFMRQCEKLSHGDGAFLWGGSASYRRAEQDVQSMISSPTFSGITSDAVQKVSEDYYGLGGLMRYIYKGDSGLRLSAHADVRGMYRDAELNSTQTNACDLCPLEDQQFTLAIQDGESGFTFDSAVGVTIGVDTGWGLTIGARADYIYTHDVGQIVNPENGNTLFIDNQPTHLNSRSANQFSAGGYAILRF